MSHTPLGPALARPGQVPVSQDALALHGMLLDHRSRTEAYIQAVRAAVRPGDVVVDLGSGTGVFGVAALRAGAARVYAIEASPMAALVRRVAAANGVADRMTVVRGWSHGIRLPEPADLVVSELVGNEPLAEGILGTTADAVRRLLRPGGRLVPSGLRILATPMQVPPAVRRSAVVGPERVRRWQEWYGMDFGPLLRADPDGGQVELVNPWEARSWKPLGPARPLRDYDLRLGRGPAGPPVVLRVERAGRLDAVLLHFELLSDHRPFLSTAIDQVDAANHWTSPVRYLRHPPTVPGGAEIRVAYRPHPPSGTATCELHLRTPGGRWQPLE